MKIRFKLSHLCCFLLALQMMMPSCAEKTTPPETPSLADTTGISTSGTMRFEGVMISVPSPAQVAALMQKHNIAFNDQYVNSIQNRAKYLNQSKKALNLGVYGSDLAYIANYNLGQINNDYFDAIAGLSSDLGILDNIDKKLVTRLSSNLGNKDSILVLNAELFRAGDDYLKMIDKPQLSSLILIGGWIESMFLTCFEVAAHQELRNRLAEQKYTAKNIQLLTEKTDDPVFNQFKTDLLALCSKLQELDSSYTYRQPITDHREKITYLRSQSSVTMSDEQMAEVVAQVKKIRNAIIE
jgi:hypothetical protein